MEVRARARTAIRKVEGGFPHSEIPGSKLVRSSPRLIAAYHVLHRLSAPRHPPNALKALDRSRDRCPPRPSALRPTSEERHGRKKTSDQAVSDPTAVCLPNMTVGDGLSPRRQSHSLFTMSDIFARPTATRDHRALWIAASSKFVSRQLDGSRKITGAFSLDWERKTRTRRPAKWDPDRSLVSNSAIRGEGRRTGHPSDSTLRKEVIQPQVPLRLPCYDFTPVADPTVVACSPRGSAQRRRVRPTPMV